MIIRRALLALAALTFVAAACGDDDTSADAVTVEGAWARTSPANASNGAVYLTLRAAQTDALVGASVPPSVAGKVELHETVAAGGDMAGGDMAGGDMAGAMTMRPVSRIELPAGETVSLAPGGLHIMLIDLAQPLTSGSTVELTLNFEQAGSRTVSVPVRDDAP
jgi:copper(I)-binding protein